MFSHWNWWYLALVVFLLGAAMLGYCRTHLLKMRQRAVQPRVERFGHWVYVTYAFCVSVVLMVLLILESLSGAMQFISLFLRKEDWTAMDFLLALVTFCGFSMLFGCVLVLVARFFEEFGQTLYVDGEIIMSKRGRLRLYNETVAIPRGARRYWIKGRLDVGAVRQLLVMDTSCQDSIARDDFVAKLYGKMPEHEQRILEAVVECMAENARKEACRRQATATVEEIIRKNIPNASLNGIRTIEPEAMPEPELHTAVLATTEKSKAPEKVQTIEELRLQKEDRPFSIKGLTPAQTEMLVSCLEGTPELTELLERSEVILENSRMAQDALADSFSELATILRSKVAFFRKGSCGLRFIITKSGTVTIKSLGGAMASG